jgi:sugar phosphate isomerase/epimerase
VGIIQGNTRQSYSLPTVNWIRFPGGDEIVPADGYPPMYPLEEVLDAAAAAGFGAVGLCDYSVTGHLRAGGSVARLPSQLLSRGLACTDVGILRVGAGGATREAQLLAALAADTGARVCIAVVATRPSPAVVRELTACAEILSEIGVRLAVEPAPYAPLKTLGEAMALCDAVGWERCGLLVDTWHFFRGDRPWELLRSLDAEQISLVHVNDAPPMSTDSLLFESRLRRETLGAGTFPIGEFKAAVDELGYAGAISPEILSRRLRRLPPTDAANEIMRSLRHHWPLGDVPLPSVRDAPVS